jgi:hypothetical protein
MRDEVRIVGVRLDDVADEQEWREMAEELSARLRETRAELDAMTRERVAAQMLRDSWHDQWRRDAGARAVAEQRLKRAEALLGRSADLLTAWAACHDDPALARRSEQLLEDLETLYHDDGGW